MKAINMSLKMKKKKDSKIQKKLFYNTQKITARSLNKVPIFYQSQDNLKNTSNFLIGDSKDNLFFLAMPDKEIFCIFSQLSQNLLLFRTKSSPYQVSCLQILWKRGWKVCNLLPFKQLFKNNMTLCEPLTLSHH